MNITNYSPQQIKDVYSDIKIEKTSNKDKKILGRIIGYFENIVNKIQKNSDIESKYGHSRKELKKLLRDRVKDDLEALSGQLDALSGFRWDDFNSDQLLHLIDIFVEIDNNLLVYQELPFNKDKKKDRQVLELFQKCHSSLGSLKGPSQKIFEQAIEHPSDPTILNKIESSLKKCAQFLPEEIRDSIKKKIIDIESRQTNPAPATSNASPEPPVKVKQNLAFSLSYSEPSDELLDEPLDLQAEPSPLPEVSESGTETIDLREPPELKIKVDEFVVVEETVTRPEIDVKAPKMEFVFVEETITPSEIVKESSLLESKVDETILVEKTAHTAQAADIKTVNEHTIQAESSPAPERVATQPPPDLEALRQELQKHIESGTLSEKILKRFKPVANMPFANGYLPLAYAIHRAPSAQQEHLVNLLVAIGADPEQVDSNNCNAFDHAALAGNDNMTKKILKILGKREIEQLEQDQAVLQGMVRKKEDEIDKFKLWMRPSFIPYLGSNINIHQISDLQNQKLNQMVEKEIKHKMDHGHHPLTKVKEGNNALLAKAIEEKNVKRFIRLIQEGAYAATTSKGGVTILDLAVRSGSEEMVLFLLQKEILKEYGAAENLVIASAIENAKLNNKGNIASLISEWPENREKPHVKKTLEKIARLEEACKTEHNALPADLQLQRKRMAAYGTLGHHPLLENAIKQNDVEMFIEAHKLGAPLDTEEMSPSCLDKLAKGTVGDSLLHTATAAGATEIVRYLLTQKPIPRTLLDEAAAYGSKESVLFLLKNGFLDKLPADLKEKVRKNAIANAEESALLALRKEITELINGWPDNQKNPANQELLEKLNSLEEACKTKYTNQPNEEKAERAKIAEYGAKQHHSLLTRAIYGKNINQLIEAHYCGAALDTYMRSSQKDLGKTGTATSKSYGSLQSISKEEAASLIDHLSSYSLSTKKANADGSWPYALALKKGDLKTACLIMSRGDPELAKTILYDDKNVKHTASLLAENSRRHDPLAVNKSEKFHALGSALSFLFQLGIADQVYNYSPYLATVLFFIPTAITIYSSLSSSDEDKTQKPYPLSRRIADITALVSKGYIVEMVTNPRFPILSVGNMALRINQNARALFSSFQELKPHFSARPLHTAQTFSLKTFNAVTPLIHMASLLKNFTKVLAEDYRHHPDFAKPKTRFSSKAFGAGKELPVLNPEKLEDAETLFPEWMECKNVGVGNCNPKSVYRAFSKALHPDKGLKGDEMTRLEVARDTLEAKYMTPEGTYLSPLQSIKDARARGEYISPLLSEWTSNLTAWIPRVDIHPVYNAAAKTLLTVAGIKLFDRSAYAPKAWSWAHHLILPYNIGKAMYGSWSAASSAAEKPAPRELPINKSSTADTADATEPPQNTDT